MATTSTSEPIIITVMAGMVIHVGYPGKLPAPVIVIDYDEDSNSPEAEMIPQGDGIEDAPAAVVIVRDGHDTDETVRQWALGALIED